MTPYLTRLAVTALSEERNVTAWVTAVLVRTPKMPKLEEITSRKETRDDVGIRLKSALSNFRPKEKK